MSNITRWDPYREMIAFRHAMDRMVDSALAGPDFVWQAESFGVPIDIVENEDEFIVKASLPGMKPEDLEITYNNNVLTIKGEVKDEQDIEESHYHLRERRYGSFARSFSLPANVNADSVKANFDQGVLTLSLPKTEDAKPKRIAVHTTPMIEAKIAGSKN